MRNFNNTKLTSFFQKKRISFENNPYEYTSVAQPKYKNKSNFEINDVTLVRMYKNTIHL